MIRKTLVAVGSLACICASVQAIPVQKHVITGAPITAFSEGQIVSPNVIAGTTTSYLDWTGTGTLASAGVLQGLLTTGLNSLNGDDAVMNRTGLLSTMGLNVANNNPAGSGDGFGLVQGDVQFFRQSDSSFIGGFNWNIDFTASGGLPGQSSSRLSFPDGGLESLGIVLDTPNVFITTEFTTVNTLLGLDDPNQVGIQIRNPAGGAAAPGSSSTDLLVLNGVPTASPFGGTPPGNTSYFVRIAPEPGSLALLAIGGLGVLRRRRA